MNVDRIRTKQNLIDYLNWGNRVKYLFFWGHQPKPDNSISKSCFSQWYAASFELDNILYPTAEHYMMAEKARLFKDSEVLSQVLAANHPGEAKKLGRQVGGFKQEIWVEHRFDIVVRGNVGKFSQNPGLQEFLLNTQERILVEASPRDWRSLAEGIACGVLDWGKIISMLPILIYGEAKIYSVLP